LGNNFGLFGSFNQTRHLLGKFHRFTSPHARIIAGSNEVYQTDNPDHLAYHTWNRQRGRMAGQIRLRVRFQKIKGPWFDYLIVSKEEMIQLLDGAGWRVSRFIATPDITYYIAIIEKTS
jgi:hypothetical protein